MKHLLYLIGQPGSGKSTLAAALTAGLETLAVETRPFAHIIWAPGVAELGARRESFSGTDALSMSVQPRAVAWLNEEAPPLLLAEGDRLATRGFLLAAHSAGYAFRLGYLTVPAAVAAERRRARAAALGVAEQNDVWVSGRVKKVRNLVDAFRDRVLVLDGAVAVEASLDRLRNVGDPVAAALDAARQRV